MNRFRVHLKSSNNSDSKLGIQGEYSVSLTEPEDGFVDVEGILHVAVDEAGRVDKGHQAELFLFRRRDFRVEIVDHSCRRRQTRKVEISQLQQRKRRVNTGNKRNGAGCRCSLSLNSENWKSPSLGSSLALFKNQRPDALRRTDPRPDTPPATADRKTLESQNLLKIKENKDLFCCAR